LQLWQAIEAVEISNLNNSVMCQSCSISVPIVGKLTRTENDRTAVLRKRIKWMECYSRVTNINDLKELKAELAELLEDAKADKLRSLPL